MGSLKSDVEKARTELTQQLMRNLLIIAADFIGYTDRLDDYFDQSIIRRVNARNDGTIEGSIKPNTIQNVESQGLKADTEITFTNHGPGKLKVGAGPDETSFTEETSKILVPGEVFYTKFKNLGSLTDSFLNVENVSDLDTTFEVLII